MNQILLDAIKYYSKRPRVHLSWTMLRLKRLEKTIEIGCLIDFIMIGKEHDVSVIIGDNVVEQYH